MSEDGLFALRNAYHLGSYAQAVAEADAAQPSPTRDFFLYRAMLEQKDYAVVLAQIRDDHTPGVKALKHLANYLLGNDTDKAIAAAKQDLADHQNGDDWMLLLACANVLWQHAASTMAQEDFDAALAPIYQSTQLDVMALVASIYLTMNRPELARKQVDAMQNVDDDATLTRLTHAWVLIYEGKEDAYKDALCEFQELAEKYSTSTTLLNAMAVCNLHMARYAEAESHLMDVLSRDRADATALVNLIVCQQHLNKPADSIARYMATLKTVVPKHPWGVKHDEVESSFERVAQSYAKA